MQVSIICLFLLALPKSYEEELHSNGLFGKKMMCFGEHIDKHNNILPGLNIELEISHDGYQAW